MSLPRYPAYKDSGVSWLGEVPEHWAVSPLKYSVDVRLSNIDKHTVEDEPPVLLCNYTDVYKNERIDASIEFMVATASPEQIRRLSLEVDDVIITKDSEDPRDIGIPAHVTEVLPNLVCGYHLALLRPREEINGSYLYHLFKSRYVAVAFETEATGMTRYALGKYSIENLGIPLPNPEEQSAIAAFLDRETEKIDALVAEQEKLIQLLREKRQAVISHAVTKGLNPAAPMKHTGIEWLGEMPKHWEVVPLKQVISQIESGVSVNASDQAASETEFGVLKTSCVYSGQFDANENKTVIEAEIDRVACPLKVGTLIVSRMNTPDLVGAAGLVKFAPQNIYLPDRLWQVSFSNAAPVFVHYWTQSVFYRAQIRVVCAGTSSSMQNLGQDQFRSFNFPNPPQSEQETIAAILDRETAKLDALTAEAQRGIALLKERRSALISAAVTGKIDVRATQLLEAA